jgi:hypothetical protein
MHPIVRGAGAVLDRVLSVSPRRPALAVVGWHEVAKSAAFLSTPYDDLLRHIEAIASKGYTVNVF